MNKIKRIINGLKIKFMYKKAIREIEQRGRKEIKAINKNLAIKIRNINKGNFIDKDKIIDSIIEKSINHIRETNILVKSQMEILIQTLNPI